MHEDTTPHWQTDAECSCASVQRVVIIGRGAFGFEAMRAAVQNGAASVTVLTRSNARSTPAAVVHVAVYYQHDAFFRETCCTCGNATFAAQHAPDCALLAHVRLYGHAHGPAAALGLEGRSVSCLAGPLLSPAMQPGAPHPREELAAGHDIHRRARLQSFHVTDRCRWRGCHQTCAIRTAYYIISQTQQPRPSQLADK